MMALPLRHLSCTLSTNTRLRGLEQVVVKDEETLDEALLLVDSGPVRYSDQYAYVIISNRDTLEVQCRTALGRGDIAIVVPQGMESEMEDHSAELVKERAQRKRQEMKDIREYFREHPERVEKVEKRLRKGEK